MNDNLNNIYYRLPYAVAVEVFPYGPAELAYIVRSVNYIDRSVETSATVNLYINVFNQINLGKTFTQIYRKYKNKYGIRGKSLNLIISYMYIHKNNPAFIITTQADFYRVTNYSRNLSGKKLNFKSFLYISAIIIVIFTLSNFLFDVIDTPDTIDSFNPNRIDITSDDYENYLNNGGKFIDDSEAIGKSCESVVSLNVYGSDSHYYVIGSGFFAFNSNTIITNEHVVSDVNYMEITSYDGRIFTLYDSDVVYRSTDDDIAIINTPQEFSARPLTLLSSESYDINNRIIAIGSPEGTLNNITKGIISEIYLDYIQFTASVYPGNSGGPLIDENGNVIGMVTARIDDDEHKGIAIPSKFIIEKYISVMR